MDNPYNKFEIPDGIEPLVGFRGWKVRSDGTLTSAFYDSVVWPVGEPLKAECLRRRHAGDEEYNPSPAKHYVFPYLDCTCGIYALHEFPKEWTVFEGERRRVPKPWPSEAVVGMVKSWGHVVIGTKGWRAEQAKPIALVTRPKSTIKWPSIIEKVADRYGLEVIDIREARSIRYGHR